MNGKQQNTYDFTHFSKNPTTNVFRRIATMILPITNEKLLILNDKLLKGNDKKSNTDYFSLPYGHT